MADDDSRIEAERHRGMACGVRAPLRESHHKWRPDMVKQNTGGAGSVGSVMSGRVLYELS